MYSLQIEANWLSFLLIFWAVFAVRATLSFSIWPDRLFGTTCLLYYLQCLSHKKLRTSSSRTSGRRRRLDVYRSTSRTCGSQCLESSSLLSSFTRSFQLPTPSRKHPTFSSSFLASFQYSILLLLFPTFWNTPRLSRRLTSHWRPTN